MTIKNVAIVGANGTLGPSVLDALLAAKTFQVTAISRQSSKSKYPDTVKDVRISDDLPSEELVKVLQGQDAIVVTFAGSNSDLQIKLADAAVKAGVKRFIPADFGSCDSSSPRALELVPLYVAKKKVRDYLVKLASTTSLTWTSLVCGHFFDHGLQSPLLQFDIEAKKVTVFDEGEVKWSTTRLETIGLATVRVLQIEEETRNRMLYIQSFSTTQNEVLQILQSLPGNKDWEVRHVKSEDYIEEVKKDMEKDPKDAKAIENMVSVVGIIDAFWEDKKDFANVLLGLETEDLEEAVKRAVGVTCAAMN